MIRILNNNGRAVRAKKSKPPQSRAALDLLETPPWETSPPPRTRGAQPGNKNATKNADDRGSELLAIAVERGCNLLEAINWLDHRRPYAIARP